MRKHRLAERLLVDVIGLEWHKVHREAGRWEHVISDDVEARLVELLGDPATCPHGNPIPGSHSAATAAEVSTRPLTEVGSGERVRLVRISEEVELNLGPSPCWERAASSPASWPRSGAATGRTIWRSRSRGDGPGGTLHLSTELAGPPLRRLAVTVRLVADAVFTVDAARHGAGARARRGRGGPASPGSATRGRRRPARRDPGPPADGGAAHARPGQLPRSLADDPGAQCRGRAAPRSLADRGGVAPRGPAWRRRRVLGHDCSERPSCSATA